MPPRALHQVLEQLRRGKPTAGVLLLGSDVYLRDLCRASLIEACVPEDLREWGVARYSLREVALDRILQQAQMRPMLAPCQVIFAEEVEQWEKLGEEARDRAVDRLAEYLDDPAPFTLLVLEAARLDQRMKLFKTLAAKTLVVGVQEGDVAGPAMAARMARELGVEVERDAAEQLSDMVNGQLARLRMEIEKLAAFVGDRRRITAADVDALVVAEKKYTVWQLAEILAQGQRDRALEFLGSVLREGEPPAAVVGALAWMCRKLLEAQELPANLPAWQAARELGMREDTARTALQQSRRIPRRRLLDGLEALSEADSRLKSGAVDKHAVMEFLAVRLAAR